MVYDSRKKYHRLFQLVEAKNEYKDLSEDGIMDTVDDIILKCYPYKIGADGTDHIIIDGEVENLDEWADKNLSSKYIVFLDGGYFKSQADATLFKLTWA